MHLVYQRKVYLLFITFVDHWLEWKMTGRCGLMYNFNNLIYKRCASSLMLPSGKWEGKVGEKTQESSTVCGIQLSVSLYIGKEECKIIHNSGGTKGAQCIMLSTDSHFLAIILDWISICVFLLVS